MNLGVVGQAVGLFAITNLVAVWCAAGRFFATRAVVATALSRWGHVLLPLVLIVVGLLILVEGVVGLLILVEGGAFGL